MTAGSLVDHFDGLVCDLDGVVFRGGEAVEHAVDALNSLEVAVVYATNNASRAPHAVAEHLRSFGVELGDDSVMTSSLAAARELATELPAGSPVLAIGGEGVRTALRTAGLDPRLPGDGSEVVAVVQGYGSEVTAADLGEAAFAIQAGARWIATNEDRTLPTERGMAPGNGSLVAAVRAAVDVDPVVIGKPHPPMYRMAAGLVHGEPHRVLAVGDRLETDIAGGVAAGMPGALVLTGVHRAVDAAAAPPRQRPTYLLRSLADLHLPYPERIIADGYAVRGTSRARVSDVLEVEGAGIDAERAALDAIWLAVDEGRVLPGDVTALWPTGSVGCSRPKE